MRNLALSPLLCAAFCICADEKRMETESPTTATAAAAYSFAFALKIRSEYFERVLYAENVHVTPTNLWNFKLDDINIWYVTHFIYACFFCRVSKATRKMSSILGASSIAMLQKFLTFTFPYTVEREVMESSKKTCSKSIFYLYCPIIIIIISVRTKLSTPSSSKVCSHYGFQSTEFVAKCALNGA